jgi:hypothetical protein
MAKTPRGVTLGDFASGRAHSEVKWQPGAGLSSKGIEDALRPRQANQPGEGLPRARPNPGERIDSNIPPPVTRHVPSNTTRSERFPSGIYPGSFNHAESARPSMPTMEDNIDPRSSGSHKDSPVPGKAERPDIAIKDKAGEVAHAIREIGPENDFRPDGTMHRD